MHDETEGVICRLGNLHPFLPPCNSLSELAQVGEYVGQKEPRGNGGQRHLAETLTDEFALQKLDVALEALTCAAVVAQVVVRLAQAHI